jgi:hypothetical protein
MTGFINVPEKTGGQAYINVDHIIYVNQVFRTCTIILLTEGVRVETSMSIEDIMELIKGAR